MQGTIYFPFKYIAFGKVYHLSYDLPAGCSNEDHRRARQRVIELVLKDKINVKNK